MIAGILPAGIHTNFISDSSGKRNDTTSGVVAARNYFPNKRSAFDVSETLKIPKALSPVAQAYI